MPEEYADIWVYMDLINHITFKGTFNAFKTKNIHSWERVGNALQKSYKMAQGRSLTSDPNERHAVMLLNTLM
jgi:hypothetical protein